MRSVKKKLLKMSVYLILVSAANDGRGKGGYDDITGLVFCVRSLR